MISLLFGLYAGDITQAPAARSFMQTLHKAILVAGVTLTCLTAGSSALSPLDDLQRDTPTSGAIPVGNCTYYHQYLAQSSAAAACFGQFACNSTVLPLDINSCCGQGSQAALWAPALQQMAHVRSLDASSCEFGETGLTILATALEQMPLVSLNVEGNSLGDVGAEDLAAILLGNQNLLLLDVRGNGISAAGCQAIQSVLPKTRVLCP